MTRNNEIEDSALESYPVKERFNKKATGTYDPNLPRRKAYVEGAEWADDTLLDKVCDWIDEHFINRVKWEIATYKFESIESMKEELRKAMKN